MPEEMEIIIETLPNGKLKLTANEGRLLTNGAVKAKTVWLSDNDSPDNWSEVEYDAQQDINRDIAIDKKLHQVNQQLVVPELRQQIDSITRAVQSLIRIDELTEEELEDIIKIYPEWQAEVEYKKDELIRYEGVLYKSLVNHVSEAQFNPYITNYRYVVASAPTEVIPFWKMPTGYENAYAIGDKVIYEPNGKVYESKIVGNTQVPTKDEPYNRYWKEI